jgi:hypothetical protein
MSMWPVASDIRTAEPGSSPLLIDTLNEPVVDCSRRPFI